MKDVFRIFGSHGYQVTRQTKYVIEFDRGLGSEAVYVKANLASGLPFHIVLHPTGDHSRISALPGVQSQPGKRYFNSNMGRFPKMRNRGKNDISFGFPITADSMSALDAVLLEMARA